MRGSVRQSIGKDILVSSTPITELAGRPDGREKLILTNDSANKIYVELATDPNAAPTATVGEGIMLAANGGTATIEGYSGPVSAIAVTGTSRLCIVEF